MKRTRRIAAIGALFGAIAMFEAAGAHATDPESTPTEYELKAAFLYNFAKFVEWPAPARSDGERIALCIIGDDPFGLQLDQIMKGKTANGRELVVRRGQDPNKLGACHIAFVSASEPEHVRRILGLIGNDPVLTVGDADDFAALGGMIHFVTDARKVRFEINVEAAEQRGLKISSKLLKLAKIVR